MLCVRGMHNVFDFDGPIKGKGLIMPRYSSKKRIEQTVEVQVNAIYRDLAESKGWIKCGECNGLRQVLDENNKPVSCGNCHAVGYVPAAEVEVP